MALPTSDLVYNLLWVAVESGDVAAVQVALEQGALVDSRRRENENDGLSIQDTYDWTPLMWAAWTGNFECVKLLLQKGASVTATIHGGRDALQMAIDQKHTACITLLTEHVRRSEKKDRVPKRKRRTVVTLLQAASAGHLSILSSILDAGVDIDTTEPKYGRTALMEASRKGHSELVFHLLNIGATATLKDKSGKTAFSLAHGNATKLLLTTYLYDFDEYREQAMLELAKKGHQKVLSYFLAQGTKPEARDGGGNTPLMLAATNAHIGCMKHLLRNGALINAVDNRGNTALMLAAFFGQRQAVELLLVWGNANLNIRNIGGETAFSIATRQEHTDCAQLIHIHSLKNPSRKTESWRENNSNLETPDEDPLLAASAAAVAEVDAKQEGEFGRLDLAGEAVGEKSTSTVAQELQYASNEIPIDDLDNFLDAGKRRLLGKGASASVYLAVWRGVEVAVKVFESELYSDEAGVVFSKSDLDKIEFERSLLASIRHPNVLDYLGCNLNVSDGGPYVVTELCPHGGLNTVLYKANFDSNLANQLTWHKRLRMAADAAAGMAYLHRRSPPVLHRDLKSPNLLLSSEWRVQISDFGLSRVLEEAAITNSRDFSASAPVVNPRWLAPEAIQGTARASSDVFGFGVILWELMTWKMPWNHIIGTQTQSQAIIGKKVIDGEKLPFPDRESLPGKPPAATATLERFVSLYERCTEYQHTKRPTFWQILEELRDMLKAEEAAEKTAAAEAAEKRRREAAEAEDATLCTICMSNPRDTGFVHKDDDVICFRYCNSCAKYLKGKPCPHCRRPFVPMKIYKT